MSTLNPKPYPVGTKIKSIITPHDHDVLSGRGNYVNYHVGNEHFRFLVKKHKIAYVACPKPEKGRFSTIIVDEVRSLDPPGRFLKQDAKTKLWQDIGDKKSLDKTRQALREGAPELLKELVEDGLSSAFECSLKISVEGSLANSSNSDAKKPAATSYRDFPGSK